MPCPSSTKSAMQSKTSIWRVSERISSRDGKNKGDAKRIVVWLHFLPFSSTSFQVLLMELQLTPKADWNDFDLNHVICRARVVSPTASPSAGPRLSLALMNASSHRRRITSNL